MKALEKEREDRYRSAEEMGRAILAVLEGWRAERERRGRERAEAARLAAEQAERERRERERAEAARPAAEAETTRLAAERTERERAEARGLAVVRAEQERLAREEAERKKQEQAARHPPHEDYGGTTPISGERKLRRRALAYGIAGLAVALAAAALFIARYMAEKPVGEVAHQASSVRTNPKDGLRYVWIPPGKFTMGCSPGDSECYGNERPAHQVTITKGFWLGQTEVTQAAYQRVVGTDPSHFKGANLPVEEVSWDEAQAYCRAVGSRLPTEAEWEYAARAGSGLSRYGDIDRIAWYTSNSGGRTHEVAQKQPNAFGLYDMLGNVWEWPANWDEAYAPGSIVDPTGPASGQYRALRGGSGNADPGNARVSGRNRYEPGNRSNVIGLRCAGE